MRKLLFGAVLSVLPVLAQATTVPVDLNTWTGAEGPGNWTIQAGGDAVFQSRNGNPTVFHNGVNSQGQQLSGTIKVNAQGDNDYIGFVLGYKTGDLTNAAADYLVIDWKQGDQGSFGCTAERGLAISRVTGVLANNSGAWCHDPANNVTELQRGTNLFDTGWVDDGVRTYTFDLLFTSTNVQVFVDGVKEIDVNGTFADGSFGFYNYSQASVTYAGLQQATLPPPNPSAVPLPASSLLLIAGMGGLVAMRRRK